MAIRIALIGVGNVASALVQGIIKGRQAGQRLLGTYPKIAEVLDQDVDVVAAFDINPNKIGRDLNEAIFVSPNCARTIVQPAPAGVIVQQGSMLDNPGSEMKRVIGWDDICQANDIVDELQNTKSDVVVILIPSGFDKTAQYYATQAARAGCSVVNGMSAEVARGMNEWWQEDMPKVAVIGDDVRSQLGATVLHQELAKLFARRGGLLEQTMQLDWGGDADFLNLSRDGMYARGKQAGKLGAVQRVCREGTAVAVEGVDYIPFLGNKKEAYIRCEGSIFGGAMVRFDVFMAVDDAYNSAGVLVDMIRVIDLARSTGRRDVLDFACCLFCKSPPVAYDEARCERMLADFLNA